MGILQLLPSSAHTIERNMAVNFGVHCCSKGVRTRIDEYVEVLLLPGWAWPRRKDMSWLGDGLGSSVETWAHGPWCITRAGLGRDGAASWYAVID
jgi:hypothetical protein